MPIRAVRSVIRRHPWLSAGFALMAILTVFFGSRFVTHAVYWQLHQNEPVAPWMTPGYIAHSWKVDPFELIKLSNLPQKPPKRMTLKEIAEQRDVPVDDIVADVQKALETLQKQPPVLSPPPPPQEPSPQEKQP